jgi:excinuclease ABC subunit B
MFNGDQARKQKLVDYGFRLPAAKDNRPLTINEFEMLTNKKIFVSATPADYELEHSQGVVVEQFIRPTHIVDPALDIRPTKHQMDDLLELTNNTIRKGEKVIITAISKRMAEEVSRYLERLGIRNSYIHSDVDTLDRVEILENLRDDMIDVIVGVNLLREGIDLPEVSLVIILDADKEGFLRNVRSITQIAGRAARHTNGRVVLYADKMNRSLRTSLVESNRRRMRQIEYNYTNNQLPRMARKSGKGQSALLNERNCANVDMTVHPIQEDHYAAPVVAEGLSTYITMDDLREQIAKAKADMERAATTLDFMAAARYRDRMYELQKELDRLTKI